jgi:hypothetical protein
MEMGHAEIADRAIKDGTKGVTNIPEDIIFVERVCDAILKSLGKTLGIKGTLDLEAFLNKQHLSLFRICQEPEQVCDVLHYLFDKEGGDFLIQTMIKHMMRSFGIKPHWDHPGFANLNDALEAIRIVSSESPSLRSSEERG